MRGRRRGTRRFHAGARGPAPQGQIFYALALIGTTPPNDLTHANQKRAAAILDPIYRRQSDHVGVAHYLIHACDSSELATRGFPAARAYAKIAPTAPHALHIPSHIFTRVGLWDDSIESNGGRTTGRPRTSRATSGRSSTRWTT